MAGAELAERAGGMETSYSARFWAKVEVRGPDECWEWRGTVGGSGYGNFRLGGRAVGAHRVAYVLAWGLLEAGEPVLHSCDNKRCCNPGHLRAGTSGENLAEAYARRRRGSGEQHPNARLTAAQVAAIRHHPASVRVTARAFGVGSSTVQDIRRGRSWRSVVN